MCGIVGLFSRSPEIESDLGEHLAKMLVQMRDRGPDSSGVAIYREPLPAGMALLSVQSVEDGPDWEAIERRIGAGLEVISLQAIAAGHAVVTVDAEAGEAERWVDEFMPELRLMSAGRAIEIFKEASEASRFIERIGLAGMQGTHGIGHTRMATESRVTTAGSHPFSTGLDLCLVHNGSLSNHNQLRRRLRDEGIQFRTSNDSEVAAGYLTWRMREGATLEEALEGCLEDLDGFFTFAVGTIDGFAVLRDPIACKPAVMAETEDWVAIASEYRALAGLPGVEDADVWEPAPGRVYSWRREMVA
jgi:amidophosphoribosyltransferase